MDIMMKKLKWAVAATYACWWLVPGLYINYIYYPTLSSINWGLSRCIASWESRSLMCWVNVGNMWTIDTEYHWISSDIHRLHTPWPKIVAKVTPGKVWKRYTLVYLKIVKAQSRHFQGPVRSNFYHLASRFHPGGSTEIMGFETVPWIVLRSPLSTYIRPEANLRRDISGHIGTYRDRKHVVATWKSWEAE